MLKSAKIHKYFLNNKYIVLDVNSGGVHVVDKIVYDILDLYEGKSLSDIVESLNELYDKNSIVDAYNEISNLVEDGLLFSDESDIDFSYNNDNIIKAMCLHVAHDCNLKCSYCFASQGNFKGERSLMSLDIGKKSLEFLVLNSGNRRNLEVDFFGGEPLMNFELVKDLVSYGRQIEKQYNKKFRFTITTNGVLLDDDKINFINENMDNIVLSLDGRKEINDNMRQTINGNGSYDLILPKFKKMVNKRGDKDYYIRGTFTNKNIDFLNDAMDFYNHGFKKISIEPVVTSEDMEYALREEHLDKVLAEYEKFSKEYINIKRKDKDFYFFHFMIDLTQGPCIIKRAVGCGAGSEYIAVTPEGDIYPCHQFVGEKEFLLGNINEGILNTNIRNKFKNSNVYTKEECKNCWAKFYCSGGCHANAYYSHGDVSKPYRLGCEMEKKRIECSISILANLED
ncbi:MAG: thioether cross-link-forming SCIFF peptide maturase [Tissierellia bacterium]|nr:thioether cross-link-forming SCIFF peptide maturase [Tissierellia bacterium]MDD4726342.1 thioether cross-link-forming SCIFF peptide maturase [Tissierellia bacterium]